MTVGRCRDGDRSQLPNEEAREHDDISVWSDAVGAWGRKPGLADSSGARAEREQGRLTAAPIVCWQACLHQAVAMLSRAQIIDP